MSTLVVCGLIALIAYGLFGRPSLKIVSGRLNVVGPSVVPSSGGAPFHKYKYLQFGTDNNEVVDLRDVVCLDAVSSALHPDAYGSFAFCRNRLVAAKVNGILIDDSAEWRGFWMGGMLLFFGPAVVFVLLALTPQGWVGVGWLLLVIFTMVLGPFIMFAGLRCMVMTPPPKQTALKLG